MNTNTGNDLVDTFLHLHSSKVKYELLYRTVIIIQQPYLHSSKVKYEL